MGIVGMPGRGRGISLSPQQQAVLDWTLDGEGSACVEAVAGSGKTSCILECAKEMKGSVAFTAFNRAIADEIESRVDSPNVRVATFHSFGLSAWREVAPDVVVDARGKWKKMMDELKVPWGLRSAVGKLVGLGKQSMVGKLWDAEDFSVWEELIHHFDVLMSVKEDDNSIGVSDSTSVSGSTEVSGKKRVEEISIFAQKGIEWSMGVGDKIVDFDDMIWLPLVHDAPVRQYDWVLVDECQDTNEARRLLAERMLRDDGRGIFIGDKFQSIYAFQGADFDAIERIVQGFECRVLPLTVTFRCSKAATRLAQTWVPHIEAAPGNREGRVIEVDGQDFVRRYGRHLGPDDAILCRLNRPLVSLAYQLLRAGVPCHVEGRDIGKSLGEMATRWKVSSTTALAKNLEAYRRAEIDKLIAMDAGYKIESVNDRVDTLLTIMDGCETVREVVEKIGRLFEDTAGRRAGGVTLSSIHKFKGREAERVFVLGFDEYQPSKWATKDWEVQQEKNLMYVAVTRTKGDLVMVTAMDWR